MLLDWAGVAPEVVPKPKRGDYSDDDDEDEEEEEALALMGGEAAWGGAPPASLSGNPVRIRSLVAIGESDERAALFGSSNALVLASAPQAPPAYKTYPLKVRTLFGPSLSLFTLPLN